MDEGEPRKRAAQSHSRIDDAWRVEKILGAKRIGMVDSDACIAGGISVQLMSDWKRNGRTAIENGEEDDRYAAFILAYDRAGMEHAQECLEVIGNGVRGIPKIEIDIESGEERNVGWIKPPDAYVALKALPMTRPDDYGARTHRLGMDGATAEQLAEAAELMRELLVQDFGPPPDESDPE